MKKVFVAGGVSLDSIIYMDELPQAKTQTVFSKGLRVTLGSTGGGKALNFNKLGFETKLHSMLGKDENGDKIIEFLDREKINFIYETDPAGTETHVNLMDNHGGRISIYTSYATFEPDLDYSKFEEYIKNSDYLVFNIINYVRNLIPIAKKYKKEIWCDIHDYDLGNEYHDDFIKGADYIFMSSEGMDDYKSFMKKQIENGKKLIVCTHGKEGATALTQNGNWIDVPIVDSYKRVDTNGAGDSFFAGYLYAHDKGYEVKKCLQIASIVAGLCVTSHELAFEDLNEKLLLDEYKKHFEV